MADPKEVGNGTGYSQGLKLDLYNPKNFDYANLGGNSNINTVKTELISSFYSKTVKTEPQTSIMKEAPWSLSNKYALFTYQGLNGNSNDILNESYKDINSSQLMGGNDALLPTTERIIDYFSEYPHLAYTWTDFLWCKYYDSIPNNYMITLRRFPTPVEDNIYNRQKRVAKETAAAQFDPNTKKLIKEAAYSTTEYDIIEDIQPAISTAVTWIGEETGNPLKELLSFQYGYKWKSQTAETESQQSNKGSYQDHNFYSGMSNGMVGGMMKAGIDVIRGVNPSQKAQGMASQGIDPYASTFPNFVIGPVNVINEMQTRDVGLSFDKSIKLVFKYDLKSYGGINPKIAILDIMANLLTLTYDNANFWGGANRFFGASGFVAPRFGDDSKLRNGEYIGYLSSLIQDFSSGFKNAAGDKSEGGVSITSGIEFLKNLGGAMLGNMLGSFLNNKMGPAPAYQVVKGMISGEATGNWHIVVGNPMNPIITMGNLILESSNISLVGPLGYDDFPSGLELEVSLKPARPRDKTDFESMFNAGKGRLYASAYGDVDFLNLEGKDIKVYGAFQSTGKGTKHGRGKNEWNLQDTEKTAQNVGFNNEQSQRIRNKSAVLSNNVKKGAGLIDKEMHF